MDFNKINIYIGNTKASTVVYQIAERQKKYLENLDFCVEVCNTESKGDISFVHKYGVYPDFVSFTVFFLHFDPYDFRHDIPLAELADYLGNFDLVICLNTKQSYFCNKRNIKHSVIPHGSDFINTVTHINTSKKLPVFALICDFYNGNVKGEHYFFELASKLNYEVKFVIMGKGWHQAKFKSPFIEYWHVENYSELKKEMNAVDILYIGSRYEAGPASFPDAVNSNKYVISTPVGLVLDNFIEKKSGYYLTLDLEEDVCNIRRVLSLIENRISPTFKYLYPSWDQQMNEVMSVINESRY